MLVQSWLTSYPNVDFEGTKYKVRPQALAVSSPRLNQTREIYSNMTETNSPVEVNVRIEGRQGTIFENTVTTRGHDVTTKTGGTHPADGTNGNEYPFKVPTCISALDDASKTSEPTFEWDGCVFYLEWFLNR